MQFGPDMLDSLPAEVRAYILECEAPYQQNIAAREQPIAEPEQRIDVLEKQFRLTGQKPEGSLAEITDWQRKVLGEFNFSSDCAWLFL